MLGIEQRIARALVDGEITVNKLHASGIRLYYFRERIPSLIVYCAHKAYSNGSEISGDTLLSHAMALADSSGQPLELPEITRELSSAPEIAIDEAINILRSSCVAEEIDRIARQTIEKIRSGEDADQAIEQMCSQALKATSSSLSLKTDVASIAQITPRPSADVLIRTQHDRLNSLVGGFAKSQLSLLVAATGFGKTAFALGLASYWAINGKSVLYIDLELTHDIIAQRMVSHDRLLPSDVWLDAKRYEQIKPEIEHWEQTVKPKYKNITVVSGGSRTIAEIDTIVDFVASERPIDIIVVDTINKVRAGKHVTDQLLNDRLVTDFLCKIAHKCGAAVIGVAQPTKADVKSDEIDLYSVRGSGHIIESAKLVISICGDRAERRISPISYENISVVKCTYAREGVIDAVFFGPYYRHVEIGTLSFERIYNGIVEKERTLCGKSPTQKAFEEKRQIAW